MIDFCSIEKVLKKDRYIIYPEYKVGRASEDLMIRGKSFYAIWNESTGFWSRNEEDVARIIDHEIQKEGNHLRDVSVSHECKYLRNFSSGQWLEWQKYVKSLPDNYRELDKKMIFSNQEVTKEDCVSHRLPYPLVEQDTPAYDEIMSTIYAPEEREKLEWAVGSIITGDSKELQKFIVLYGPPGSGKSTFLNIIQGMFPGYYSIFNARNITGNKDFAMESLKENPLFAIQHDGDLSRIEDNTLLNSIVSHEEMEMNEKYKSKYLVRIQSFLFMGTNKPVRITDSKSGIIRRLIDVRPTGERIPRARFDTLLDRVKFEYSGIAWRCLQVYQKLGYKHYDNYVPLSMIGETNDIFNFIEDNYEMFKEEPEEGLLLSVMWRRYRDYCEIANIQYPLTMRLFKVEMKEYFNTFREREGNRYSVYRGFRKQKFERLPHPVEHQEEECWLKFEEQPSLFDEEFASSLAQYATDAGTPFQKWSKVRTNLSDLDTSKVHYVRLPECVIVIDFDLKDGEGNKSFERNFEAASKWPPTYAELSKSGAGIHLHYIYKGDPTELSRVYGEDVEVKVFTGNSSLRRKLTTCNTIGLATISSGLLLKGAKRMIENKTIRSEQSLRSMIGRNLKKEFHPGTKPSIDFIYKILNDANEQGLKYDVRDLRPDIQQFAMNSTHQADYCIRMLDKMKFVSDDASPDLPADHGTPIIFFDVEVFPNLFVLCYTKQKSGVIVRLINPDAKTVEDLLQYRLVGFNNRKYDNHILYARMMGYNEDQLYKLSKRIIDGDRTAFFRDAYNLSYTDIYDFLSAQNKMGLKKWEIKLRIHHRENAIPWDQPVPKERWNEVADYCANDVFATEAVWDANQSDWRAREILAEWSGLTVNDTTNNHTTRLIVGKDPRPQDRFIYTDLSTIFPGYEYDPFGIDQSRYNPGTKIIRGKSFYMGEDPGEGGYAWAKPGMYTNVALLDVESMHPHSAIRLKVFGEEYTMRFADIVNARLAIKHGNFEEAKQYMPEKLHRYLDDPSKAKELANALKTAINSVYGLTSASFENKLRDPRNKDNIVAKYGALFMIKLKYKVQEMGYTVVHIKTDSIKIADADDKIIQFVMDFGKEYGYTFDHEDTYSRMCIVNDAVYVAKYKEPHFDKKTGKEVWWTATGTQFQVPYVFKTLFSKEPIDFWDLCETRSVTTALYLDMNESLGEDEHNYKFVGRVGLFCPVLPGCGGGILLRQRDDTYSAVTGTKKKHSDGVFRWMEAEEVQVLGIEDKIDREYYNELVDNAIEEISKYGDFEWFANNVEEEPSVTWSADADLKDREDSKEYEFGNNMNPPMAA